MPGWPYLFGDGGLLPRPGPEGLPVLLGQFGLLLMMFLLFASMNVLLKLEEVWARSVAFASVEGECEAAMS